jgi:biopolymer transport protein ExbD
MMSIRDINAPQSNRRVRTLLEEAKGLSITSLLDVLTIILVFLIKNVSMEAQKIAVPDNMNFPTTMMTEALSEKAGTTIVKIYPDRILIGTDNLYFGTLDDLENNAEKRENIMKFLQSTALGILESPTNNETVLLIQADNSIPCQHITTMVALGTSSYYQYVYFATLQETDWLARLKQSTSG